MNKIDLDDLVFIIFATIMGMCMVALTTMAGVDLASELTGSKPTTVTQTVEVPQPAPKG